MCKKSYLISSDIVPRTLIVPFLFDVSLDLITLIYLDSTHAYPGINEQTNNIYKQTYVFGGMGYRTDLSVGIHSTYLLKQHCLLKRVMRGEPTGRMLTASISTVAALINKRLT